ncbi:hypothetical protein HMPREF1544_10962 [Mucor circinelloides 1006PhL]|uniref:Aspartic peptidase DDI1-type domain-containing protein n=1 Tax=Mucor circinelloides f. circinelloides (strain 1006PhL) TaxID=1220926 RepID=S2J2A0_MUCC1|nr:hypothetical protein HMPREF1544_10962 [Mucor circinelloides 1006PhL]
MNETSQSMQVKQTNLPVLTQAFAPKLAHKTITPRVPLSEKTSYDIKELLHKKADIDIGNLLVAVPALKRELLIKAIGEKTSNSNSRLPLTSFEDDDLDSTAIYTDFVINDVKVKSMLDTGSAKTCMSSEVAAKLGLFIDAASTSVSTLGNGTKQSSLAVEVLPVCPANLTIGNYWMKRAKAELYLEERLIKVEYKGNKIQNNFNYTRRTQEIRSVKSHNIKYHLVQDNKATQQVAIESSEGDSNASAESEEDESDEDEDDIDSED